MTSNNEPSKTLVVCEKDGEHAAKMREYLAADGLDAAKWLAPRDVDDVDEAVRKGEIRRVVFTDLGALLDAMWDEEIQFGEWLSAGVEVSFVDTPTEGPIAPDTSIAAAVFESWRSWRGYQRRRRVVAGLILSVVALLAGLLLMLPTP